LVAELGEPLEDGQTLRDDCPECGRRKTFTITRRDEGLVYNCYSANCDLDGGVVGASNRPRILTPGEMDRPKRKLPEPFAEPLVKLVTSQEEELNERFNLHAGSYRGVRWCPTMRRYAFPILGPLGERRGYVLRSLDPSVYPKALTHLECDAPALSWHRTDSTAPVVAVEDIPSALRLWAAGHNAVALLGTSCGADKAAELSYASKRIVWALDADATKTAVHLERRHRFLFDGSVVAVLKCDIKDMTEEEFDEFRNFYL
jgi:hypothetical protein